MHSPWPRNFYGVYFPTSFFDRHDSPEVPRLLRLTFETYPDTEAAAKAYYHWLNYQAYWDFDGDRIEWEQQQKEFMKDFLARYPDSPLADDARERLRQAQEYIASHEENAAP